MGALREEAGYEWSMFQAKGREFVRTKIEENIASKSCVPGEKLPNDVELARLYGVNRHTVRYAIQALEEKGILRVDQGGGHSWWKTRRRTCSPRTGDRPTTSLLMAVWPAETMLSSETMVANERLAKHLEIGEDVLFIRPLSFQDEIPIVIANTYFPAQRVPGLLDEFLAQTRFPKH